jgi:hypothetical protein
MMSAVQGVDVDVVKLSVSLMEKVKLPESCVDSNAEEDLFRVVFWDILPP